MTKNSNDRKIKLSKRIKQKTGDRKKNRKIQRWQNVKKFF